VPYSIIDYGHRRQVTVVVVVMDVLNSMTNHIIIIIVYELRSTILSRYGQSAYISEDIAL